MSPASPRPAPAWEPFAAGLARRGLALARDETAILQINIGLACNQSCRHCHLAAGPDRPEAMSLATAEAVADYAARSGFAAADVTGGAPELWPHLERLLDRLAAAVPALMLRSNLTALTERPGLAASLARRGITLFASFPSLAPTQAEAQRGAGVFARSLAGLDLLNRLGYGRPDSGLELHLVVNPAGAFPPPDQAETERRFRRQLADRHGLSFNRLVAFANAPLGRFREWLESSGNMAAYMDRLAGLFNPAALDGVMCRRQVSVAWDGVLHDCDFNIAAGLPLGGRPVRVGDVPGPPRAGDLVAVGDHCYACTAGAGFT